MRLVLPGLCLLRAAASVQVMDEQCRHERLGGSRFEDLEAEPGRACVRRGQHPVFGDRPGTSRRGDVHGYGRAAVTGDGGTPALHTLGEGIVGALLGHQAVADAGIGTRRIGGAEQPPAGQSPQRPAAELGRAGPGREGADGLGHRIGRDGEHVGGRREERESDVAVPGPQALGQRVDGAGDAEAGKATPAASSPLISLMRSSPDHHGARMMIRAMSKMARPLRPGDDSAPTGRTEYRGRHR